MTGLYVNFANILLFDSFFFHMWQAEVLRRIYSPVAEHNMVLISNLQSSNSILDFLGLSNLGVQWMTY